MNSKSIKKCVAVFMAAVLAASGGISMPKSRVMAQETQNSQKETVMAQETQTSQKETGKKTVQEAMFPYIHTVTGSAVKSDNIGVNNYFVWSATVKSYLQRLGNGNLQLVEARNGQVIMEEYSPDYELISKRQIAYELPIFGGYFCGKDNQFLVFGQSNMEESNDKEIMRIVKYDKEWKKLESTSVCGANTTVPFSSGSLRMAEENGKLFIHTCHQMYTSDDGLRHQANMTYVVAEESMKVEQSWYEVMNIGSGYVSHSFNQFLIAEDGKLYRMDHGDGYPRSIIISKCNQSAITSCGYKSSWLIQGEIGKNTTKVSVGGFEKAGKYLVVAGNSCTQETEEAWNADNKRNIFLTSTNANTIKSNTNYRNNSDTEEVLEKEPIKKIWLTNYSADDVVSVRTPHLVKASDNLLYVMWEELNTETNTMSVKIVGVDAQGNKVTDIASIYGRLSDCKPIYESDGTIQWYTSSDENAGGGYGWDADGNLSYMGHTDGAEVVFYKIDTGRLREYQFTEKFDFSEVEVSIENTEFIYNPEKEECTPKVVAVYKGVYLEEGRDFGVYYENNKKPGQAKVTLTGKGCFSGSKVLNFTIKPIDISGYTLVVEPSFIVYDGKSHCPECSIYDGTKEVTIRGTYQNKANVAAGVYTVKFSADEYYGYSGTLTTTYEIASKSLEEVDVSIGASRFIYSGKEIETVVTVKDGTRWLTRNKDYIVRYKNNVDAGEAVILLTGMGNYKGTRKITFEIVQENILNFQVSLKQISFTADGTEKKPLVTVKRQNHVLELNKDYTLSYTNNIEPGIAEVVVRGIGNYKGEIKKEYLIQEPVSTSTPSATEKTSSAPDATIKPSAVPSETGRPSQSQIPASVKPDQSQMPATVKPGQSQTPATIKPEQSQTPVTVKPGQSQTPVTVKPGQSQTPATVKPDQSQTPATIKPDQSQTPENLKPGQGSSSDTENGDGTQGVVTPEKTTEPANGEKGSQNVTAIKTGTRYKDSATKSWYQITKASNDKYEAAYLKPVSKNTTTLKIPDVIKINGTSIQITSVAKNACAGCKKVTKVTIGANVTKIGSKAFYQCSQLKSITIPKKVTKIDDKAFEKDRKLASITIKTTKLTKKSLGSSVFANINQNAKIIVPKAKKKSYEKILRKTGIKETVKIVGK